MKKSKYEIRVYAGVLSVATFISDTMPVIVRDSHITYTVNDIDDYYQFDLNEGDRVFVEELK